jgi:chemotaxis protein MotB
MEPGARPIIIIKKKGGHGGHHGGAWKVAYADFVTAMMALFIVLWLLNTSKPVKEAIAGYFKDPSGSTKNPGTNLSGSGENFSLTKDNMPKLKQELEKAVRQMNDFDRFKNQVEMTVTAEGLRIEMLESANGTFFDTGSSKPTEQGKELLIMLAQELNKLPNKITIEGHTDSKPYVGKGNYGNWELSADRANITRRLMQESGLREDQVSQVRGYADQNLRKPADPLDPSNRRITLIVQYIPPNESPDAKESPSAVPAEEKAKPSAGKPEEK